MVARGRSIAVSFQLVELQVTVRTTVSVASAAAKFWSRSVREAIWPLRT